MDALRRICSQTFKLAAQDPRVKSIRDRLLAGNTSSKTASSAAYQLGAATYAKEAGTMGSIAKLLAGLGLAGGGVAAGRYLAPRDPSETEALTRLGITEPGEYSVDVPYETFEDTEQGYF